MYFSQTFLQVPAAWQLSHNVLLLKMFIANYSWTCHGKAISSMLPLNEITPAISLLGARGEFEEMIATEEPLVIVIAVVTAKNRTMFSSFLWRRHNPIKYQRNDKKSEEKQGKACFVLINSWCTIHQVTRDVTSYRVLHIYITGDVTLWFKGSVARLIKWFEGSTDRWFVSSMDRWIVGSMVRWIGGSVVRWFDGSLVRWFDGLVVQWFDGSLVWWFDGSVVQWFDGSLVR